MREPDFMHLLCVCGLTMWSDYGQSLEEGQIFIVAERLKLEIFGRGSSLVQSFVKLVYTLNLAVHMIQRFVI